MQAQELALRHIAEFQPTIEELSVALSCVNEKVLSLTPSHPRV